MNTLFEGKDGEIEQVFWKIFIGLVISFGAYGLARYKGWIDRRRAAEIKFESVLGSDLRKILSNDQCPGNVLTYEAVERHISAQIEFSKYLHFWERSSFDRDWAEYCCDPDQQGYPYLVMYHDAGALTEREKNIPLLKERIEKLLSYIKHI